MSSFPFFFPLFFLFPCLSILSPSILFHDGALYVYIYKKDGHFPHVNHGDSHVILNVFKLEDP